MARRKRNRVRLWASIGCLGVVLVLAGAGALVVPGLLARFRAQTPAWASMPFYGPSQDVPVRRDSVAEGIAAYGLVRAAREAKLSFEAASGEVALSNVQIGSYVFEGQPLVELDRSAIERDLAQARADLLEAENELDEVRAGAEQIAERLRLQVDLATWQQALDEARQALRDYDAGTGTPAARRARAAEELDAARTALDAVRNDKVRQEQIDYLQWVYNPVEVKHGEMASLPNPSEMDRDITWLLRMDMLEKRQALDQARLRWEADIQSAEDRVAAATRALAQVDVEIRAGAGEVERMKRVSDARNAEAKVMSFEERIASLEQGVPTAELAKAQAKVLKAQGRVDDAEAALADAALVAPFDGMVVEGTVLAGQIVSVGTPLVTIEDTSSLQIVARVNEIDIGRIAANSEVRLSFEAYAGQPPVSGTIGEIPLYGKYENGITMFDLPIQLDTAGLPLFQGMSANIIFPLAIKEDVLVVPAAAVFRDIEGDFVLVVVGGATENRYITKGVSDGVYTEVIDGLHEGEIVRVPMTGPQGSGGMYYGGMY